MQFYIPTNNISRLLFSHIILPLEEILIDLEFSIKIFFFPFKHWKYVSLFSLIFLMAYQLLSWNLMCIIFSLIFLKIFYLFLVIDSFILISPVAVI